MKKESFNVLHLFSTINLCLLYELCFHYFFPRSKNKKEEKSCKRKEFPRLQFVFSERENLKAYFLINFLFFQVLMVYNQKRRDLFFRRAAVERAMPEFHKGETEIRSLIFFLLLFHYRAIQASSSSLLRHHQQPKLELPFIIPSSWALFSSFFLPWRKNIYTEQRTGERKRKNEKGREKIEKEWGNLWIKKIKQGKKHKIVFSFSHIDFSSFF